MTWTVCGSPASSFSPPRRFPSFRCCFWKSRVSLQLPAPGFRSSTRASSPAASAIRCKFSGSSSCAPTLASMILSLESVFAVLFGWILLHQALSARELLGLPRHLYCHRHRPASFQRHVCRMSAADSPANLTCFKSGAAFAAPLLPYSCRPVRKCARYAPVSADRAQFFAEP